MNRGRAVGSEREFQIFVTRFVIPLRFVNFGKFGIYGRVVDEIVLFFAVVKRESKSAYKRFFGFFIFFLR